MRAITRLLLLLAAPALAASAQSRRVTPVAERRGPPAPTAAPARTSQKPPARRAARAGEKTPAPTDASPTAGFAGRPLEEWVSRAVDDTSLFRRDRAISALRRAPAQTRAAVAQRLSAALRDTASERRVRVILALGQLAAETQGQVGRFDGIGDLTAVLPTVVEIASDRNPRVRGSALWLLSMAGVRSRNIVRPVVRDALRDSSAGTREAAVAALGLVGDSSDVRRIAGLLADPGESIRAAATTALGALGRKQAVPDVARMLGDPSRVVRAMALRALGTLGPAARDALPAVAPLLTDTTHWRTGSYAETIGEEAAWAASRILPRRGVGLVPAFVEVDDADAALRSDGFGAYVTGADSVKAFVSAALNLDLSGPRGDGRTMGLAVQRKLRRSLTFDLSHPLSGSGAKPVKPVSDNEAVVHLFFAHEHDKRMISITMLDPTDATVECQRAEFQFRIDGEPYLLQMGEWSEGEFNPRAPRLGGEGTTSPRILHPTAEEWTVYAPPGSAARLWNLSDPAHPVDRGLYFFPFSISWTALVPK